MITYEWRAATEEEVMYYSNDVGEKPLWFYWAMVDGINTTWIMRGYEKNGQIRIEMGNLEIMKPRVEKAPLKNRFGRTEYVVID